MPTEAKKPRRKWVVSVLIAAMLVLPPLGGVALYLLGREDPRDPALSSLDWGNRVERRLDAFIDGNRPGWADPAEDKLDAFLKKLGWN